LLLIYWLGDRTGIRPIKPKPLNPKGSVSEEVEKESQRGNWLSQSHLKRATKMDVAVVAVAAVAVAAAVVMCFDCGLYATVSCTSN